MSVPEVNVTSAPGALGGPDVPADAGLDPVSRLLLAEAPADVSRVALVDPTLGLEAAAGSRWADVSVYRDRLDLGPGTDTLTTAVDGADLVLLALPTSLGALEETAETVARHAAPGVRLVAAGRVKHMTPRQNGVLARSFAEVRAGRGVGKCRPLHARAPRDVAPTWPRSADDPTTGLRLVAHGATFAGTRLDAGTRLLLQTAGRWPAGPAVDVGCGNGVLTASLARQGRAVTGIDVSRAAVAATTATLTANGLDAVVLLGDGLAQVASASMALVVTNPPFHVGAAKDSTPTLRLLADAPRVLRPGGELWCVFNSHLPYLRAARDAFNRPGDGVDVVTRDRSFTVLRARRG